jgi:hypothetical protein
MVLAVMAVYALALIFLRLRIAELKGRGPGMDSCVSRMDSRTPKENVLVGGLDDWADTGWIYRSTSLAGPQTPTKHAER